MSYQIKLLSQKKKMLDGLDTTTPQTHKAINNSKSILNLTPIKKAKQKKNKKKRNRCAKERDNVGMAQQQQQQQPQKTTAVLFSIVIKLMLKKNTHILCSFLKFMPFMFFFITFSAIANVRNTNNNWIYFN